MLQRFSLATLALALLTLAAAPSALANAPADANLAHISITVNTFDNNPVRGEGVFFRGPVANTAGPNTFVYVYFVVQDPNGFTYKQNLGGVFLDANQSINFRDIPGKKKKNFVPLANDAAAGTYTVTIYAASDRFGSTIYSQDSFQFTLPPPAPLTASPASGMANLETTEPQAGPNPFRTQTDIRYTLVEESAVDLRVFDVTGRQVAALASGVQAAGTHAATLRADDLPSGVYVWRLAIDGEVTTGRVTLAR